MVSPIPAQHSTSGDIQVWQLELAVRGDLPLRDGGLQGDVAHAVPDRAAPHRPLCERTSKGTAGMDGAQLLPSPGTQSCSARFPVQHLQLEKESLQHGTEVSGERQLTAPRIHGVQAHFPFWQACPAENDTITLTAYKKISKFIRLLCDQLWQHYTCVQNWSNLLSLNATYRLLFSQMILM